MNAAAASIRNERGSILGAVILVLALLTLIGFASIQRSNTEVLTAGNEIVYKQNIYNAEAAAVESIQRLRDAAADDLGNPAGIPWLNAEADLPAPDDMFDPANWTDANSQAGVISTARFLAVSEGIVPGGSLDMSKSQIRGYSAYGQCRHNKGLAVVRMGFRRAF